MKTDFFRTAAIGAGCFAIAAGLSTLLGWALGSDVLKSVMAEMKPMNPLSALDFLLCGVSLLVAAFPVQRPWLRRCCRAAMAGVAISGVIVLAGYLGPWDAGIDRLLFAGRLGQNRMAPNTAVGLLLLGTALFSLLTEHAQRRWLSHGAAIAVALGSLLSLVGYAFGVTHMYGIPPFIPMAMNSALTLLVLSLGVLSAAPNSLLPELLGRSDAGAIMARRLVPAAIVIPILLSWLRVLGERAGWYDDDFGISLHVWLTMVLMLAAVAWTSRWLTALDADRRRAWDDLQQSRDAASQQQIEKLNVMLRQQVQQLVAGNRELQEKNRENEMFVYSVSHDLRSPLVNLQGFSKELGMVAEELHGILQDDRVPAELRDRGRVLLEKDMAQFIGFIHSAVKRLGNIIDALLRLSRVGRVEYRREQVDCNSLLSRVVEASALTIADRGAQIQIHDLPSAYADAIAVEMVFANLIDNALNYLDRQRPGVIEVGCVATAAGGEPASDARHTYYVRDNGLGIVLAHQAKIFQAFQRAHPHVAPGEGMGLAIVRRIVERHGGEVWVESKVGVQTTFFFTLPAGPKAPVPAPARPVVTFNMGDEHDTVQFLSDVVGGR